VGGIAGRTQIPSEVEWKWRPSRLKRNQCAASGKREALYMGSAGNMRRSNSAWKKRAHRHAKREQLEDPAIASDGPRLLTAHAEMEEAQEQLDTLYARWAELERKKADRKEP